MVHSYQMKVCRLLIFYMDVSKGVYDVFLKFHGVRSNRVVSSAVKAISHAFSSATIFVVGKGFSKTAFCILTIKDMHEIKSQIVYKDYIKVFWGNILLVWFVNFTMILDFDVNFRPSTAWLMLMRSHDHFSGL